MIFSIIVTLLILGILYPTLLYPLLLSILAKIFNNKVNIDRNYQPEISIIIAAYNEEKYIHRAIDSILNSDYPASKISLFVGSDGSNDSTVSIANSYSGKFGDVKVLDLPRMGKNQVLNSVYPHLRTDIVYFMDADFRLKSDALSESIKYFADSNINGVMSKLSIVVLSDDENSGTQGEGAYQKLERYIKTQESIIWTTVNNFGFYGVRRSVLRDIPNANVCDDMFNVLSASVFGGRMIFAPESNVEEVREKSATEETKRRIRLASGGLSTSFAIKSLLNPFNGWAGFFFVSHKFIRYFFPFIMILIVLVTPLVLTESRIYFDILVYSQSAFYLSAAIGYYFNRFDIHIKLFSLPFFFVSINLGFLLGAFRFISGKQNSIWERIDTRQS